MTFKMFLALNILITLLFVLAETLRPARKIDFKEAIPKDLGSLVVVLLMKFIMLLVFVALVLPLKGNLPIYHWFHTKPFYFQFIFYVLAVDFGMYWSHRLMHTAHVWRIHRWHHYPSYMYWGAGLRATIFHQSLFYGVHLIALPILQASQPFAYIIFSFTSGVFTNNFMHMNVVWKSKKLEWFVVTPRYHHVHHSVNFKEHNGNYGAMFTIWDRLFGSYVNPDNVKDIKFGTGDKEKHPLMFLGL